MKACTCLEGAYELSNTDSSDPRGPYSPFLLGGGGGEGRYSLILGPFRYPQGWEDGPFDPFGKFLFRKAGDAGRSPGTCCAPAARSQDPARALEGV